MTSNAQSAWYHGSPLNLTILEKGSTITRDEKLARVFSTRPKIVSIEDDGTIRHNGKLKGRVYRINETIGEEDIHEHPASTMNAGLEWITSRELKLAFLYEYAPDPEDLLSKEEINELMNKTADE